MGPYVILFLKGLLSNKKGQNVRPVLRKLEINFYIKKQRCVVNFESVFHFSISYHRIM